MNLFAMPEIAARMFNTPLMLHAAKADVIAVDGVRVRTRDGWWLLRASNTQDVLVARCEAGDEEGLARLKQALAAELERSGVSVPV